MKNDNSKAFMPNLAELYNGNDFTPSKGQGHVFTIMDVFSSAYNPDAEEDEDEQTASSRELDCSSVLLKWDLPEDFALPPCGIFVFGAGYEEYDRGLPLVNNLLKAWGPTSIKNHQFSDVAGIIASIFLTSRYMKHVEEDSHFSTDDLTRSGRSLTDFVFSRSMFYNMRVLSTCLIKPESMVTASFVTNFLTLWNDDLVAQTDESIVCPESYNLKSGSFPAAFHERFFLNEGLSPELGKLFAYPILNVSARPDLFDRLNEDGDRLPVLSPPVRNELKKSVFAIDERTGKTKLSLEVDYLLSCWLKECDFATGKKKNKVKKAPDLVEILDIRTT
jgi:hypothetical protein